MVSATGDHPVTTVAGLEMNTLADGFFHLFSWWDLAFLAFGLALVLAGWLLARSGSRSLDDRAWTPTL